MLGSEDGKELLALARKSIESYFSNKEPDISEYERFSEKQGVFVTLNKKGQLRGCIGFPYPIYPLHKAIFDAARAAAFEDPRFPRLAEDELQDIDIEISVLTVPQELEADDPEDYPKQIDIGKDGLIVKSTHTSGLLLPQVFTEHDSTPEQALEMTCEKAGLPKDAWKERPLMILKFQAQIWKEK